MAHNPFLSMGEPIAPVASDTLNPFMVAETEQEMYSADNPFATSNPFSDFTSTYEPPVGDTVPMDIFGNINTVGGEAKQYNDHPIDSNGPIDYFTSEPNQFVNKLVKPTELDLSSTNVEINNIFTNDEDTQKPKRPPPPAARPLPPETQNLILSVTGQMDFTSSHLLDRIPPTRTPSPVSMRDIHSPCPTPEPDVLLEDDEPHTQNIFQNTVHNNTATPATDIFDINQNKPSRPARPPPARPQPPAVRPPPPRPSQPVPAPVAAAPPPQDDINLFDAPVATVVKPTKEAILSLYSTNKKEEEKQIDFLSDDIVDDIPECSIARTDNSAPYKSVIMEESMDHKEETIPNLDFGTKGSEYHDETYQMDCSIPTSSTEPVESLHSTPFSIGHIDPVQNSAFADSPKLATDSFFDITNNDASTLELNSIQNNPFELSGNAFDASSVPNDVPRAPFATIEGSTPENLGSWGIHEAMAEEAAFPESEDAFDAFSAKFDSTFSSHAPLASATAWGDAGAETASSGGEGGDGFEAEVFDPFLSMGAPPAPAATPRLESQTSRESTDDTFSLFIRPKESGDAASAEVPVLAPPPRPQALPESPRFNPFDASEFPFQESVPTYEEPRRKSGSGGAETPPTPLFDDDVSVPLEDFPRIKYTGPGWEMHLRQPNKKKITGQRFWKKVFIRLTYQGDNPVVQLFNSSTDKEPFQELPLQACYSVSEIGAQQFDQFGKIFTVKLQYVFYKERPGVRPGQVTKAERITNKLSQFAAYAIQGDYQGVKEFGSDLRKLGLPVEHAPQLSQLFKLGSLNYEDVKQFSCCIEEALFRLPAHRDRALNYKMEEVQVTAVDELYVEQDAEGSVMKQIARVRLFFLGFLSGMPDVELGVNDLRRQGREVVGRHDIIPVATEEWIRVENQEFHACVQPQEFLNTQIIKFKPPDASYIELMRFRVRPPKNRELPLQLKATWCVTGNKVELRADVLVPGFASRKLGQVPCEDVAIRFPIPECWIYLFRVEKHFRYGSVKSAHRRTGKIKGIERLLGAVDAPQESLIEVTSGQAKYEHPHRAIVWRMPRLPKEGQGAYTTHNLVCRMALTSYDQVPAQLARAAHVEFTMPATQVSHTTVRSVSLQEHDGDPPEKYVRYLARHEYVVGIERTSGQEAAAYTAAAAVPSPSPSAAPAPSPSPSAAPDPAAPAAPAAPSSDSDSD